MQRLLTSKPEKLLNLYLLQVREIIKIFLHLELQLRLHDAYEKEKSGVEGSNVVQLKKLSEELVK